MNVRLKRSATGRAKTQSPVESVTHNFFWSYLLIGGTIWVIAKVAVFVYNKTIGSSVDGFFANNSSENIVFWVWLIVVGLFIGNLIRNH